MFRARLADGKTSRSNEIERELASRQAGAVVLVLGRRVNLSDDRGYEGK